MLTYSYKLNTSTNKEEIEVNDFYISSDLSFISGTTSTKYAFGVGDKLWVNSSYYPKEQSVKVTYCDTVKRNGFLTYSQTVDIKNTLYTESTNESTTFHWIKYIEFNGNTYFQNLSNQLYTTFLVNGELCAANVTATTVNVRTIAYIEDNTVVVNGIKYNVIINEAGVTFSDFEGNPFDKPSDWDITYVSNSYEYVKKFSIGNKESVIYPTKSITRYGYRPYINYKGERLYLSYLYDENGIKYAFGVNIDGEDYVVLDLNSGIESGYSILTNPYDKSSYLELEQKVNYITIGDLQYQLNFDADDVDAGDVICLTMKSEHVPILLGDKLLAFNTNREYNVKVEKDVLGNSYVSLNGYRHNKIKNLCDCVIINGNEYLLSYDGDVESPYVGMTAHCKLDDGGILHFKVNELQEDGSSVKSLYKIKYDENGKAQSAYTMSLSAGTLDVTVYTNSQLYTVNNYDGIQIGDSKIKILTYSSSYDGNLVEYDYISLSWSQEYKLEVIDTIGSNRILCRVDMNPSEYADSEYYAITNSIIDTLTSNTSFSILRRSTIFGDKLLTYSEWLKYPLSYDYGTSVYELSNVLNEIHLKEHKNYICFPINLSKNINNSLNQSDLIMNFHYDDVADKVVNKIVDMEKDMYTPVFIDRTTGDIENVEEIEFNLHFRTRDLETWKIIEDEGTYDSSGNTVDNSMNNMFSNWFVTDYYPYNAYSTDGSKIYHKDGYFDKIVNQSDLLGFLYFTTNDVQVKRKKLSKSFLRITYFDSKDPTTQNILGTSTMYFDCDRYFDTLYTTHSDVMYAQVVQSIDWDRVHNGTLKDDGTVRENAVRDRISINTNLSPTVLTEAFKLDSRKSELSTEDLALFTSDPPRLDSRITVSDRYTSTSSSEGFYSYILKAFANKKVEQTIYMKLEFFHAGIGIKLPMVMATDYTKQAIKSWDYDKLDKFKKGYELSEIYDRLYIPIKISYSRTLKKFVYTVADENNHLSAARDGNKLRFNLFELKIKPQ